MTSLDGAELSFHSSDCDSKSISPSVGVKQTLWSDSEAIRSASAYVGSIMYGSGVTQSLWRIATFSLFGSEVAASKLW